MVFFFFFLLVGKDGFECWRPQALPGCLGCAISSLNPQNAWLLGPGHTQLVTAEGLGPLLPEANALRGQERPLPHHPAVCILESCPGQAHHPVPGAAEPTAHASLMEPAPGREPAPSAPAPAAPGGSQRTEQTSGGRRRPLGMAFAGGTSEAELAE